jgi:hypothetical protein
MKRHSLHLVALLLAVALIAWVGESMRSATVAVGSPAQLADAAFRDGVFQARIDVENGRKPHLSSGRWSTDQDRASFIAGYEQNYRALLQARAEKSREPNAAEVAGYRDGMFDGARHRKLLQPFQVDKTDNYRRAGQGLAEISADVYRDVYRFAYRNGYQQGYYIAQETPEFNVSDAQATF